MKCKILTCWFTIGMSPAVWSFLWSSSQQVVQKSWERSCGSSWAGASCSEENDLEICVSIIMRTAKGPNAGFSSSYWPPFCSALLWQLLCSFSPTLGMNVCFLSQSEVKHWFMAIQRDAISLPMATKSSYLQVKIPQKIDANFLRKIKNLKLIFGFKIQAWPN